ncbi:hypothetical protein KVR01_002266 [Diaporthe batatas]|uniref:uncharacterized protein n=1 Tax=Diaporthe batatas TaxID=748121 RepID=UPI001D04F3A3|nr:uncharacterized protein KVR01_002266 [Diaporthe batatas]KAG8166577.1 hypothetical protein KVR01_002266 [Diaporthe batatas]
MSNTYKTMDDRALEEGAIGLPTSGEISPNQDWENPLAVRSASQSPSPPAFIPRTNENDPRRSATDELAHFRRPRQGHSRPLSKATYESVIVPETRRPGGVIHLDPGEPGLWLVDHHLYGLIEEIVPSEIESFPQRIISCVKLLLGDPPQGQRLNKKKKPEETYRISFAEMQRMHLRKLQISLVDHAVTMYSKKEESNNWERDLAAYIQAMKDYDYMVECSRRERDPCLVTGERKIDHYVTQKVVKAVLDKVGRDQLEKPDEVHPLGPWEHDSEPIGGTRTSTLKALSFKDFRDRLFLATLGAALLLGPMWLMVLHNTLYTCLVTTTVCVAAFGLVVVFWLDKRMDVVSATAAYAAVLVVFVGLTTDSS